MAKQVVLNTIEADDFQAFIKEAMAQAVVRAIREELNPPKATDDDMLTREQTAKLLCVSLPTLHNWTLEGLIRAYRIGNRVLYKKEDVFDSLTPVGKNYGKGGKSC